MFPGPFYETKDALIFTAFPYISFCGNTSKLLFGLIVLLYFSLFKALKK
jgi:hypothetical protein